LPTSGIPDRLPRCVAGPGHDHRLPAGGGAGRHESPTTRAPGRRPPPCRSWSSPRRSSCTRWWVR
jgi:hypothetical protein